MEEKEIWKRLLGIKVPSMTDSGKDYSIFYNGEDVPECDCMDFKIRKGSHVFFVADKHGEEKICGKPYTKVQTCKHVGQFLADAGNEVYELCGMHKNKIEPTEH